MQGNRTITHTVHDDDGGVEIYFARAGDDFPPYVGYNNFQGYNSIQIDNDGTLLWKGWTDNGIPVVVAIRGNRVVVANTEDIQFPTDPSIVLFDSEAER